MDALEQRVPVLGVDVLELEVIPPLLAEGLDRGHAGDVLVEVRIQPRQDAPALPVILPRFCAIGVRGQDHHGKQGEAHEAQAPVQEEHGAGDPGDHQRVAEEGDDAGAQQLVQVLDVVDDAGHQAADGVPVEEGEVVPLEVPEELLADVVHHPLADVLGGVGVGELEEEAQDDRGQIEEGHAVEPGEVPGGDVPVDGDLDEVGAQELGSRVPGEEHDGQADQEPVRPEVRQQAEDQPGVVRLPQHLVVNVNVRSVHDYPFSRSARASSSLARSCFWYSR